MCVATNELVLVSVQQGVYLQAFGELMKEFPCCLTAKKKQESRKAGARQATRGPASSGGLHEEHVPHKHSKHFSFPRLESPGAPWLWEHPSAQPQLFETSLEKITCTGHLGTGRHSTQGNWLVCFFSENLPNQGKAPLRPSPL